MGAGLKYLRVECSSYLTVASINLPPYLLIAGNQSSVAWSVPNLLQQEPKLFKSVGVFIYLLTQQDAFYKIDTRDRSITKGEGEDTHNFAGSGIDFTLKVKDKNVFSIGGN